MEAGKRQPGLGSADIEKKRWGTLTAMLTYEQSEPDHGFAKCMAPKLTEARRKPPT